jgi:hypothetical protein
VSKIKRLRPVLSGLVAAALAVATLPVLAITASAAADPLGGQAGPVTLSPTMGQDQWQPNPPAGTSVGEFMRHPVLSWTSITTLPVTAYRVQISPNAEFTNNAIALPNSGLTMATQYDLPQTLPHGSYYWRVRGEDAAGHATLWTGAQEGDYQSTWQFTKTWIDAPGNPLPANGAVSLQSFSWQPIPDASAYELQLSQNAGFPKAISGIETYTCTTNHTSFSPSVDFAVSPSPASGTVEGSCGDFYALMKELQLGGTWFWRVRGIDGTTAALTPSDSGVTCYGDGADCGLWTPIATLTLPTIPNTGATLVPTNLSSGCSAVVPGGTVPLCYDTPTLTWTAVPNANSYLVETSEDPMFTTDYHSYLTVFNTFAPRQSFHDTQAGRSYYWRVSACDTNFDLTTTGCTTTQDQAPSSQFHKASPALPLTAASAASTTGHNGLYVTTDNNQVLGTAVKQVRGQQMTFHWDDLLQYTQQAGIQSSQEARNYRLEYTTSGDWLTAITVDTDATHWTKQDGPLADGGYYWRVAAVDGSGNILSWSPTQTVVKGTIAPTVTIGQTGLLAPTSAVSLVFLAPVSGVSTATLGLRTVNGGTIAGHIVWPAPDPMSATFTPDSPLLPGERVIPWVSSAVVDLAGNSAKASTTSALVDPTVDSASPTIKESWSRISTSHASGGSYAKAAGARDAISFSVNGSSVSLRGVRTPDGGYGTVYVDGVKKKTVNFYAKTPAYGVSLWSALLSEGHHTVTVTVKGAHPASSKGNAVNVDGVKVDGRMVQQTSAVQAWSQHRSTDAFKGSYNAESSYLSTWKGSKPTLSTSFAGTAVHIVGCKSPDGGQFAVYIDGKLSVVKDGYQKFTTCNKTLVKITGLSSGAHTVTIAAVGTHQKAATGTKVSVDAIVAS